MLCVCVCLSAVDVRPIFAADFDFLSPAADFRGRFFLLAVARVIVANFAADFWLLIGKLEIGNLATHTYMCVCVCVCVCACACMVRLGLSVCASVWIRFPAFAQQHTDGRTDGQTHAQCFVFSPPQQSGEGVSASRYIRSRFSRKRKFWNFAECILGLVLKLILIVEDVVFKKQFLTPPSLAIKFFYISSGPNRCLDLKGKAKHTFSVSFD